MDGRRYWLGFLAVAVVANPATAAYMAATSDNAFVIIAVLVLTNAVVGVVVWRGRPTGPGVGTR